MKKFFRIIAITLVALMLGLSLVSCGGPNSDPDKALAALKDNGISAAKDTRLIPAALMLLGVNGIDCVVSGTGKLDENYAHVTIIYFTSSENANNSWEKVQEYANEEKSDDAKDSEWVCEKSGKMIYFGTKNAIKAAK